MKKQVAGKTICGWKEDCWKYFDGWMVANFYCKKFRRRLKATNRYQQDKNYNDGIRLDKCKELWPNGIWQ